MYSEFVICNAFSMNMLDFEDGYSEVSFMKVDVTDVINLLNDREFTSAVGHADTAAIFSDILGIEIPMNRIDLKIKNNTVLIVGQYKGKRLPEGTKKLPDDAVIEWYFVETVYVSY